MGVAAYNRGTEVIRRSMAADDRPAEFGFMDRLNNLEKYPDAGSPPEDLVFTFSRGVWWVNCASRPDGFGYWYKSLHEAVRRWRVQIVGFRSGVWLGAPI